MSHGNVLFIIAHEGYQPIEYNDPKQILEGAGFKVVTASDKHGTAKDKDGNPIQVDLTLKDVHPENYDGVFFIGGPGAMECLDNEESYRIIKAAAAKHLPLGAICISTRILAKAGALTRKQATGWNGDGELENLYKEYDVFYMKEPVVVQENIITASGPEAAKTFGQEIMAILHNNKGWG